MKTLVDMIGSWNCNACDALQLYKRMNIVKKLE
jgi:hypothetical protein